MFIKVISKKKLITVILLAILVALCGFGIVNRVLCKAVYSFDDTSGVRVPIIMYHSVLKDPARTGKYTVTPDSLEADLKYLKENNYTAIFVSDLIQYVYEDAELPAKPIIITFDDGYLNNLTYAFPLLQKYDMKATISVVGSYSELYSTKIDENVNYAHLTWDNIAMLNESGYVEIGNHTYNMHETKGRRGSMKKIGESVETYRTVLTNDIGKLQKDLYEKSNVICDVYTYPFGSVSEESLPIIKSMHFRASLSCYEKVNYITKDPDSLYVLGRFNRSGKYTTQEFMNKIEQE